jgi:hypothetical protein
MTVAAKVGPTLRKTSCLELLASQTFVRLPSLLRPSFANVDACRSVNGRPVVLAVRASIF